MEILSTSDGIAVQKRDGTNVIYHIFKEYEIHYNELAPSTIQAWHHHEQIEETLYMLSGTLIAHWAIDGVAYSQAVKAGDIIRVENTPHTFVNSSFEPVRFLVFRLILDGTDKRQIIKNDKHLDAPPVGWEQSITS